ncbi:winged helix-turn-helix domain-containing protein [Albimonas sp. CAU 1670]|uniref:winged helix-turn-helix domain-containing protein n=1 Tax=Albimonas sp. CAU 1670 TaxID=3032599 RepID=UPI0023DAA065|nr:winged helix-turn-helix domain-containing protein [Albimonas sp. CAU 1670]MDF2235295.1 winged helix-turn-helix domain-containing protein [Albimonas sp. CAU 1670]
MIYAFGPFEADAELYELRRDGAALPVEPLVFNILLHLIERRDRIVPRDELVEAIWDGRAVAETTISSRLFALRKALGDSGAEQSYVRTIPRRGFRFVAEVEARACAERRVPAGAAPAGPPVEIAPEAPPPEPDGAAHPPTLLILPFKAASAETDKYLCDGLTEDLIGALTRFRELRVIAGGTAFHFRASAMSPPDIAGRLGADFIVAGSARSDARRIRLNVQLVDAATGVSLWAGRYDREVADLFEVQDELTRMVAAALGVQVQDTTLSRALRKTPPELDAYDCLLRARRWTASLDDAVHAEARELLERAVALDPTYAEAHALLSNVYLAEHRFGANPRPDPLGRALATAQRATELDPQSAYARCWLAIAHFFRKDNATFQAEMQRALDLNPNDPEILAEAGHYLAFLGEHDRGVELSRRARRLNPLHPGWYHFASARHHYHRGDYEAVLVDMARVGLPGFYWSHILNAAAQGQLGRPEAALSIARMRNLRRGLSPAEEIRKWNASPQDLAHLMEGLRKAGLEA